MRIDVLMLRGNLWAKTATDEDAPEHPASMFEIQQLIFEFIRDQLVKLVLFSGSGHSCCMQSFISLVDHYAASLCHLQRAQWVFEQFLGTLKSSFASVWVFAHPLFSAESPTPPLTTLPAAQIHLRNGFMAIHSCCYFRRREAERGPSLKACWARQRYTWCWVNTFSHRYITPVWPTVAFSFILEKKKMFFILAEYCLGAQARPGWNKWLF